MLDMRRANAIEDSNPKVIENICQPSFIEDTSTKKVSLHILHVDDDQTLIEVSKQILTIENNFEIESALSVKEAFQKLGKQNYDAIISDYEMPLKDGLDFLKELRQQQNDIPFILFTGKGREEVVVKALNLGADCYINKNGSPETVYCELADAINKTVKRKKAELEHKKSGEALIAAGEKFRTIFENVHDVITYVDTRGKILDVNNRVEDLLGYKPEEIIGKNFVTLGLIKFGDSPKLLKLFLGSLRKGEEKKIVLLELKHKSGSKVSVEVRTRFIRDKNRKIVSIVNIFRDVTENKKAEAALVESEKKFRKVFAIGHDAFLISTLKESTIIDINERFTKMFGYTIQEAVGKSAIELGLWANLSDREKIASHLKSKGKIENIQISCRRKNGELFPILLSVSLIDANNQQFVLSTVRDLSTSKHAETALKESEEKFRNLAEESPNIIFINKSGRIVYANKKSEEITGYTREELYSPNFNFLSLSPLECVESIKSYYSRHLKGEVTSPYNYELMSKNGKRINAIITSKLIEYEGEKAILGIVTDISELKKAEEN
ncbi:MAG TPA: PAS domain S-box protein, partial [Candidatus Acidoferrum sp.]|nr:PAS domain S-box protein [Candidatus Acidoferrum sp.]